MNEGGNISKKITSLSGKQRAKVNLIQDELGKLPPQSLELEEAVLGALLLDKDALTDIIEILTIDSFYKESNQKIYSTILHLFDLNEPIDILTVAQELRKTGELDNVGGAYYISKLTSRVNSSANVEFHARIIAQNAIKRNLISIASEILKDAYEDQTDVFDLLDTASERLFKVSENNIKRSVESITDLITQAKTLLKEKESNEGPSGVPSGFTELDKITGGWQKSDLIILAARPGMGKTAFVVSTMRNAAVDAGKSVAIFSLEMPSIQLANRLISAEAEIDSSKMRHGNLEDYEWEQLNSKVEKLSKSKIFIDDTPALSIREFKTKCRRLKHSQKIDMVIIDYLQLMTGVSENGGKGGNREQEIASISRALKGVAKDLEIPVIALAQLSRAVETRGGDKKPMLSDLRESGSIEQDADMVLMLYRPEYYGFTTIKSEDGEEMPADGVGELIISKNRHGSTSSVYLHFLSKFTKFVDGAHSSSTPSTENIQTFSSSMNQGFPDIPKFGEDAVDTDDAPF